MNTLSILSDQATLSGQGWDHNLAWVFAGLFSLIDASALDTSKMFILEIHLGNISDPLSSFFSFFHVIIKSYEKHYTLPNILSRYKVLH